MKTDCKKRSDDLQKHLKKTGAAPDDSLTLTAQEERILGIMNVVKTSLENPFDDDSTSACSSKTYSCSSAPAVQDNSTHSRDDSDSRADSRADQDEDIGSGDDEIEIVEGLKSRSTPTPVKRRKELLS